MGCLTAPFKVLGCLGVLAALLVGWLYRDRVVREGRQILGRLETPLARRLPAASAGGRAPASLAAAHAKIDSLNGWRADSVVLTPAEVASLMGRRARAEIPEGARLAAGGAARRRSAGARPAPHRAAAPGAGRPAGDGAPARRAGRGRRSAPRPRSPARVSGRCDRSGSGTSRCRRRRFRAWYPVHWTSLGAQTVPWTVPAGIRAIRIRPGGATLYGAPRP